MTTTDTRSGPTRRLDADGAQGREAPGRARRMATMGEGPVAQRRDRVGAGYSRFVQLLRYILPGATVLIVLLVALWPEFNSIEDTIAQSDMPISLADAERLTMSNPRYTSRDDSGMVYMVTADVAEQLDGTANQVSLVNPAADVTLEDGTWVMLSADHGEYWNEEQRLNLAGAVSLFHDSGYELHTEQATIDFAAGRAQGDQAVAGFGPFGDVQSEGFAIEDRGAVIIFTGKSHMVLRPDEEQPGE